MTGRPSIFTQSLADAICIYVLRDPRTGDVRYVGKANGPGRRLATHITDSRKTKSRPVCNWIKKLTSDGLMPIMEVVEWCPSEQWEEAERAAIKRYREAGVALLNIADGGMAVPCPPAIRAASGKTLAKRRNPRLWAAMRSMGQALQQGYVSEATKAKMRARPDLFGQFARFL